MGNPYGRISDFTVTGVKEEVFEEGESKGLIEKVKVDAIACQIEDVKGKPTNTAQASIQFKLSLEKYRAMTEAEFEAKLVEKGRKVLSDLPADAPFVVLGGA